LGHVELALQQADIKKQLVVINPEMPWLVAVISDKDIPVFPHPITLNDPNRGKKVVVDLRSYGRMIRVQEDRVQIEPYGGASLSVNRAILQYFWSEDTARTVEGLSNLPVAVYSRWLSEQIIRGLAVEEVQHHRLRVVFAYFYYALFAGDKGFPRPLAMALAGKISDNIGVSQSLVLEYLPETIPTTVPELVALLSNGDYGLRLQNLNVGTFYTTTTKGFFGVFRPDEVLAAAIEYPPTFLAILYAVVNDRSFVKTNLTQAAKPFDRKGAFKDFNIAYEGLLGNLEGL
jgi:hypothetical protein